jgi:4-amino-4-deoxy-L-arabinose transferase-like glycosyltransferase
VARRAQDRLAATQTLWRTPAAAAAIVLSAYVARAWFGNQAFDVFFDEGVYLQISQHLARYGEISYNATTPFFLHPPLFFFFEGLFLGIVQPKGDFISQILMVRFLNAVFGALTAGVVFYLVRRIVGDVAGFLAAAIFTIEPFLIRIDSRNLLEPSAELWILLGVWGIVDMGERPLTTRRSVLVGLAFAAALLTNEPTFFVTVVPLGACWLFRWAVPRRSCVEIVATAMGVYSVYPMLAIASGNWGEFYDQKLRGLMRFFGQLQLSGFNANHGPTFQQAVAEHASEFATTYTLMAAGVLALLYLWRRRSEVGSRAVLVWTACAYVLQGYSIALGTNEEQYFYYLVVVAIIADIVAAMMLLAHLDRPLATGYETEDPVSATLYAMCVQIDRMPFRVTKSVLLLLTVLLLGWAIAAWPQQHLTPDDAYRQVFDILEVQARPGTTVAGINSTDFAMVTGTGYHYVAARDPNTVLHDHAKYVLVSTRLTEQGYTSASPALRPWLEQNATLVAVGNGRTTGKLFLYRIED